MVWARFAETPILKWKGNLLIRASADAERGIEGRGREGRKGLKKQARRDKFDRTTTVTDIRSSESKKTKGRNRAD